MKSLLVVIALTVVCVQADIPLNDSYARLIVEHRKVCLKKSNVDPALLEKARKGDFSDDPSFKKHVLCVSKEIGFQDPSGKLVPDVLKTKVGSVYKDKTDDLLAACIKELEHPEDIAVTSFKCFYEKGDLVLL